MLFIALYFGLFAGLLKSSVVQGIKLTFRFACLKISLAKPYQLVATNPHIPNQDNWTQRYATRGSEYFKTLREQGIPVSRFELYLTRQSMHLNSCFLERSPADCKFLQQALTNEWGIDLPANMMPMSQLEAIIGAILARENAQNNDNIKQIAEFRERAPFFK